MVPPLDVCKLKIIQASLEKEKRELSSIYGSETSAQISFQIGITQLISRNKMERPNKDIIWLDSVGNRSDEAFKDSEITKAFKRVYDYILFLETLTLINVKQDDTSQ